MVCQQYITALCLYNLSALCNKCCVCMTRQPCGCMICQPCVCMICQPCGCMISQPCVCMICQHCVTNVVCMICQHCVTNAVSLCSFGVVCAFVTNEYMEDGTQKLPSRLRTSISDTKLYLSNTQMVSTCLVRHKQDVVSV